MLACRYWIQILIRPTTRPLCTNCICFGLQLLTVNVCTVCARFKLIKIQTGEVITDFSNKTRKVTKIIVSQYYNNLKKNKMIGCKTYKN